MTLRLKWPKIYILGDSLTQFSFSTDGGWAGIIADEFQRKADIVARGFSGYNSRQCKQLLPYLESDFRDVSIAGVFLGANDANDPKLNPQQAVPLDEYKKNMKDIITFIKNAVPCNERASATLPMFLIAPPPLNAAHYRKTAAATEGRVYGYGSQTSAPYAAACVDIAREMGITCVDLHTEMLKQDNWREYLSDGLHLSRPGAEFVARQLKPVLETFLKEGDYGSNPEGIMPLWGGVNPVDPDSSFRQWLDENGNRPGK